MSLRLTWGGKDLGDIEAVEFTYDPFKDQKAAFKKVGIELPLAVKFSAKQREVKGRIEFYDIESAATSEEEQIAYDLIFDEKKKKVKKRKRHAE